MLTARAATSKNYRTPIICLVMEGGSNTIRSVLDCLTDVPPIPVVVCDGSGRAADLLAFTHKYTQEDGSVRHVLSYRSTEIPQSGYSTLCGFRGLE